jgi:hypothetical protein
VAIWLWLAFSFGGYVPRQWLPPVLALGLFGLVAALLVAYPRRPRQLSSAVLALFAGYAVWVAASAIWAASTTRVWLEAGRTLGYLLLFALAVTYFTDAKARRGFRYLLMGACLFLLAACVVRLWTAADPSPLFFIGRLAYPASYPNNAAALFLVGFWPLMWLASGPEERAPVRGVALGLATGLLGLALMTQSRGGMWSLAITVVLMFLLSPARLRMLFYLLVPALLMVYAFPQLNRYWLEGPAVVGGSVAARTLLTAALAAVLIGTVLALLERWVKVSGRMKAVFGTLVLAACVAGLVYGAMTLTEDSGGPFRWVSQTWQRFTADPAQDDIPETEGRQEIRFTEVSSSGRVNIWKVAWRQFEAAPLLGVGADNFVFEYNRLRTVPSYKPQQAHSITLQLLGDTGVVGAVLALGGAALAAGGILWPRFASGWAGARATWLRRRRARAPAAHEEAEAGRPERTSRWGRDASVYGWEMGLSMGATYWFIHANVEWLWQMAGVSIPALLMLAAGVAAVDARAGALWPRLSRWLRSPGAEAAAAAGLEEEAQPTVQETASESFLPLARRAERHTRSIERRERRAARRRRSDTLLVPPGPLSRVFRILLAALSVLVLLMAGLPYLSFQFQDSARGLSTTDALAAVSRVETARWLVPGDPGPYQTKGALYAGAARKAMLSDDPDRAGAVVDDLALALAAQAKTAELEPADWTSHYRAAWAALDLFLARAYAQYGPGGAGPLDLSPYQASLHDWSALAGTGPEVPSSGEAAASLAKNASALTTAASNRALTQGELLRLAHEYIKAAQARSPLEGQVGYLKALIESLSP